jgi:hypothetical protein
LKLGFKVIGFKVMTFAREIVAFLLIAALVTGTATAALTAADHASGSAGLLAASGERPAGCHAHSGMPLPDSQVPHSPAPTPASYRCCLIGHDVAVVQASYSSPFSHQWTRVTLQIAPALAECSHLSEVSKVLSADPPDITPLRI